MYDRLYPLARTVFCLAISICFTGAGFANAQTIKGKVYAFKNLELNSVKVMSKKSGNITYTDGDGTFSLQCHPKDKIVFSAKGFERICESYKGDSIFVKMLFKGGASQRDKAVNNGHVSLDDLDFCMKYYVAYNCYPSPKRLYVSNTRNNTLQYTHFSQKHGSLNRNQSDHEFSLLNER